MTKGITRILSVILLAYSLIGSVYAQVTVTKDSSQLRLATEYGEFTITEPVVIELIESPAFNRLKLIHQYGVCCYSRDEKPFTRYDHSLGVFALLRRYGAPLSEQIAGLLHDVSHTVFSHVGDVVFDNYYDRYSYQDNIHEWYLQKVGITDILVKHDYGYACSINNKKEMRMLEQDKPDLCLDRVEYLIRGGLVDDIITEDEVEPILQSLYFENQQWLFKDQAQATKLAMIALKLTENIFGTPWNLYIYHHASLALKHAVQKGIISMDDIHFSTDDVVWHTMKTCGDSFIQQSIDRVVNYKTYYAVADEHHYDQHFKAKFLGVDPLVDTEEGIMRLSVLDASYKAEYERVQKKMAKGCFIKFIQ